MICWPNNTTNTSSIHRIKVIATAYCGEALGALGAVILPLGVVVDAEGVIYKDVVIANLNYMNNDA
jgi:hypothetical protein